MVNKSALLLCLCLLFGADGAHARHRASTSAATQQTSAQATSPKRQGGIVTQPRSPLVAGSSNLAYTRHSKPREALAEVKPSGKFVLVIDAGHGGKDAGAIGANGTLEKDVVLAIARKLEALARNQPGMKPIMVRQDDRFIGLTRRAEIAREAGADLFISLHADAYVGAKVQGSAVFVLAPRPYASYEALGTLAASDHAARNVLGELLKRQAMHYRQIQRAHFAVLKSPDVPSLLIETGFVSNPQEEVRLSNQAYQSSMALSIFRGVLAYRRAVQPVRQRSVPASPMLLASKQ